MFQDANRQAFWLLKNINKAIYRYGMIQDGDRVAVAVSGGKDSLSLLRLLDLRRSHVAENYDLVAVHILSDARGPDTPRHQPLEDWLQVSGIPYEIETLRLPAEELLPMNCQRCAWNRRRALFEAAGRLECNAVALGHHFDDLAQTTLLNLFFHGRVETMQPRRDYFGGRLRLTRPLCLTEERELRRFARACGFPTPPPVCPHSDTSRRKRAADLIRDLETTIPSIRANLVRAGLRGPGSGDTVR